MNALYIGLFGFILIILILVVKSYFFSKKCEACVDEKETDSNDANECVGGKCPMRPKAKKD